MQLLRLSGDAIAFTADSAALSITNNLDLRIRCVMDKWHLPGPSEPSTQTFIDKRAGGDEWQFCTDWVSGRIQLRWWNTGGTGFFPVATADLPFEDGQTGWIRVRKSGTSVNFWYSETDTNDHTAVSWTALGGTVTTDSGSIRATVGTHVVIGGQGLGRGVGLRGFVHTAAILDDTTVRADPRFYLSTEWTVGEDTGDTASDGVNTWTLAGEAEIVGDNIPKLPGVIVSVEASFGSGPYDGVMFWEDLTKDTRQVSFNRGRMYELDRVDTGTATLELENFDGKYNAHNTTSPYYPNVKPNVPIRIRAVYEGTIYPLWSGFVDRWPVNFPGNSDSLVSVSCSDLFKLLAKARVPNPSFSEAVLDLTPRAYWRFTDTATLDSGPEADHTLSYSGGTTDQAGVWLNDEGVLFNGTSNHAVVSDGAADLDNTGSLTLMAWVNATGTGAVIAREGGAGTGLPTSYELTVGPFQIEFHQANTLIFGQAHFFYDDDLTGEWQFVVVTREPAGSLRLVKAYRNGEFFGQKIIGAVPNGTAEDTTIGAGDTAGGISGFFDGVISEAAIWDSVLTQDQIAGLYAAQIDDYIVQRTDERIVYLFGQSAVINGVPFTDYDLDLGASNMSADDINPSSLLDALQSVVDTERGLAFMTGAGVYRFQNRYYRLTQQSTPIATLDEDVYTTPTIGNDDDLLANDISVTPGDGAPRIARDETSIGENGRGSLDVTIYPADDNEALDHAYYLLGLYSEPLQRLEALDFELDETKPLDIILGAELSNRYNVEVPLAGDDLDVDVYLERIEHTIDLQHHWSVSWQLSHAGPDSAFWLLGVPGFSELGTTTKLGF